MYSGKRDAVCWKTSRELSLPLLKGHRQSWVILNMATLICTQKSTCLRIRSVNPLWAFDLAKGKKTQSKHPNKKTGVVAKSRTFVTLPFVDGLSQTLQQIYGTYGIATSFKTHSTLRKQLVSPKDPAPADKKSDVVYETHCMNSPDIYFGHTGRQLGERLKEH